MNIANQNDDDIGTKGNLLYLYVSMAHTIYFRYNFFKLSHTVKILLFGNTSFHHVNTSSHI